MNISFNKKFKKQLRKFPEEIQNKFYERLKILVTTPAHPSLHVHRLNGEMSNLLSINVAGDVRALFVKKKDNLEFQKIGTHSELYE